MSVPVKLASSMKGGPMRSVPKWLVSRVRSHGIAYTTRLVRYHLYERFREWYLRIETATHVDPYGSGPEEERRPYEPMTYNYIDPCFAALGVGKSSDDVLLDYGSGQGRIA